SSCLGGSVRLIARTTGRREALVHPRLPERLVAGDGGGGAVAGGGEAQGAIDPGAPGGGGGGGGGGGRVGRAAGWRGGLSGGGRGYGSGATCATCRASGGAPAAVRTRWPSVAPGIPSALVSAAHASEVGSGAAPISCVAEQGWPGKWVR